MRNKDQTLKGETAVDKYSKVVTYIPFKADFDFQKNSRDQTVSLRYFNVNN